MEHIMEILVYGSAIKIKTYDYNNIDINGSRVAQWLERQQGKAAVVRKSDTVRQDVAGSSPVTATK